MKTLTQLGILCLVAATLAECGKESKSVETLTGTPVIIISVDTLRADHLPIYGYTQVQTPNIDALRKDSILYSNAYAQAPLTLTSHLSLLTGEMPAGHGVRNNLGYVFDAAKHITIPQLLKRKRYATGAAISAYVLRSSTGIGAAFDFYDDAISMHAGASAGSLQRPGTVTAEVATKWIDSNSSTPFFFLLHLFEPHSPYEAPPGTAGRFALPYDGEIAAADGIVGNFIENLKRGGLYDRAVVIFLSDHGEGLDQHGEPEHGIFVYREDIHVPLLIKLPKSSRAGETVSAPVGLFDLLPTICDLTGIQPPANLPGISIVRSQLPNRSIYSESMYGRIHLGWSELRSLAGSRYHYIQAPRPELYDMVADHGETRNLIAEERRAASALKKELERYGTEVGTAGKIDPEEAAKLAALGYLGSSAGQGHGPLPDPKDRIGELHKMQAAMNLANSGKTAQAVSMLKQLVAESPRFADGWNQLALILDNAGQHDDAAAAYRKAIEVMPTLASEFGLSMGAVLVKLRRYDEALRYADLGAKSNPGAAAMLRTRIALAQQRVSEAEKAAREAAAIPFYSIPASVLLAQVHAHQGRFDESAALLDRVTREARDRNLLPLEGLDYARGDLLARMGKNEEAERAFEQEIGSFPRNKQTYATLAVIYLLEGRQSDLQPLMQRMFRSQPTAASAEFAAYTLGELGDVSGAQFWRRRAEEMRKSFGAAAGK